MYRIDNETNTPSLPPPEPPGLNPDGYFTSGDPNSGIPATILPADFMNSLQEEICNVITHSGLTLSKSVHTQLRDAIKAIAQQNLSNYATSSSSSNTYTAALTPAPSAYTNGMLVFIRFINANTGAATLNLNSLGAIDITRSNGDPLLAGDILNGMIAILSYDGTNFQLLNPNGVSIIDIQNDVYNFTTSASAANTYTANLTPAPAAYTTGMRVLVKFTNANTGVATLNLNSLGAIDITRSNGGPLLAGDISNGMIGNLIYDGTNFQLLNPNGVSITDTQNDVYNFTTSTSAANTYTANLTPAPAAYTTGMRVLVKFTNANTGVATLNLNSLGAIDITRSNGSPLLAGDISGGMIGNFAYDGTNFQLLNENNVVRSVKTQTFISSGTYTPSAGLIACYPFAKGGGGSGGGTAATSGHSSCGGGGGEGGLAYGRFTAAQIGASQSVTIGAGGIGIAGSSASGGNTTFGSLLTANGGSGGPVANATSINNVIGGGNGGTASGGFMNIAGASGTLGVANTVASCGGTGGGVGSGHGLQAGAGSFLAGTAAQANTGGGGGGSAISLATAPAQPGANGANGFITVTEYCSI